MTGFDPDLLDQLRSGPLHRFADFDTVRFDIPGAGAGVYTIWDDEGALIYVGIAGRNPTGKDLRGRLTSHASGRRSGDQFCVYVGDHYVLPTIPRDEITASAESRLSMDLLIRNAIRDHLSFRYVTVPHYRTALAVEQAIKNGHHGQNPPRLNPALRS